MDEADLELYFETDFEKFGETQTCELKPNGKQIKVTDANKEEYLRSVIFANVKPTTCSIATLIPCSCRKIHAPPLSITVPLLKA